MHPIEPTPAWKVLLLGGHSGVGKTIVARHLARRYGVALAEVDDFRLVLQRMTTSAQQPVLHFFLTENILHWSVDEVRDRLIAVNRIVCSALEIVVANHVATHMPIILEGDGLLPTFAAQPSFADLEVGNTVRAAFIIEDDQTRLFRTMQARGRGFDTFSPQEQQRWVQVSWAYGQWLHHEAGRYKLSVVPAQPWATLTERVAAAIEA